MPVIVFVVVLCIGITIAASYKTLSPEYPGQSSMTARDAFRENVAQPAGPEADVSTVNSADRAKILRQAPGDAQRSFKTWVAHHKH
jgi:hypothetical protein